MHKLRLTFVLDPSLGGPLGAHVPRLLTEEYESVGLIEEGRIANETAPGREAVLLTYQIPAAAGSTGVPGVNGACLP